MLYVIAIAALLILWLVAVDRPVMRLIFKDGELDKSYGNIPQGFGQNCKEIARKTPFTGTIKVYSTRSGSKLTFTKSVPHKIQQRIRNVFPHQGLKHKGRKRA
ncbi:DUF3634 domain-containing protein [Vibrio sp. HA2012]|uniref:DUF3634 family protein n=1 Tax=Vibrio sp. HA2012 TaxID=1971595 RepID=UPI000C2BFA25|nr:DUF3634 family protein [Vibrio sp. HA2012]PJC87943.1 DUF3634 domain-containing protein [Vibrio sp. HA2012]